MLNLEQIKTRNVIISRKKRKFIIKENILLNAGSFHGTDIYFLLVNRVFFNQKSSLIFDPKFNFRSSLIPGPLKLIL